MGDLPGQSEWDYVGHYGQLGPLTLEQMTELASDGVVSADTFVWKVGLVDWVQAQGVPELRQFVIPIVPEFMPPPAPGSAARAEMRPPPAPNLQRTVGQVNAASWHYLEVSVPKSDKSRVTAGLLNLMPGVGRFYMGYAAHGALQLLTALFCGVGFVWSIIDGIYILMGGVKYDGYGRILQD